MADETFKERWQKYNAIRSAFEHDFGAATWPFQQALASIAPKRGWYRCHVEQGDIDADGVRFDICDNEDDASCLEQKFLLPWDLLEKLGTERLTAAQQWADECIASDNALRKARHDAQQKRAADEKEARERAEYLRLNAKYGGK